MYMCTPLNMTTVTIRNGILRITASSGPIKALSVINTELPCAIISKVTHHNNMNSYDNTHTWITLWGVTGEACHTFQLDKLPDMLPVHILKGWDWPPAAEEPVAEEINTNPCICLQ